MLFITVINKGITYENLGRTGASFGAGTSFLKDRKNPAQATIFCRNSHTSQKESLSRERFFLCADIPGGRDGIHVEPRRHEHPQIT